MGRFPGRFLVLIWIVAAGIANGISFFVISGGHYTVQIVLGIVCFLAAAFSVFSFILQQKENTGTLSYIITVLAGIFNVPVAFNSIFWLLWIFGFQLLPPPQR